MVGVEPVERRVEVNEIVVYGASRFRLRATIVNAVAVATCCHQSGATQNFQMVAKSGLRNIENPRQFEHAERIPAECAQDIGAQRIRYGAGRVEERFIGCSGRHR